MTILHNSRDDAAEAANLIIFKFPYAWAYFCQFRFALAVFQRVLMRNIQIQAPSLEIGMNDGSSAAIAHFGKPKFSYGADMPEENTYESMGLHVDPNFDVYENVIGMDAHEIPFPDGSFNTIVTNDMLSYGVDREKILQEMVRVLAPGGTIFLSETTGNINKYPYLLAELRRVVPTVDTLDEPLSFYREKLSALGMVDIDGRTYFDHRLCAVIFSWLLRGEVNSPIDERKAGFYNEGLRALASILAAELAADDEGRGWQVCMSCRKPGDLRDLPIPMPICLKCGTPLTITLNDCVCARCGAQYRNELGNPYVLSDYRKSYSPKRGFSSSANMQLIEGHLADFEKRLLCLSTPPSSVSLLGFDKSTRFIIRSLAARNIPVSAIYSDNPLFIGREVLGIPIRSHEQARGLSEPMLASAFCSTEKWP